MSVVDRPPLRVVAETHEEATRRRLVAQSRSRYPPLEVVIYCNVCGGEKTRAKQTVPGVWRCVGCGGRVRVVW